MATTYPIGDSELLQRLQDTNNQQIRGLRQYGLVYDDGVAYEPDRGDSVAPQWTTSGSTTPYPTRERPRAYRMRADDTLELVEENGSAINPVEQPVQLYQTYPVLPYSPLDYTTLARHQKLADKVDELTRTVELLQTALKRLERQQPDVEPHGIDKQPNRKLIIQ